MDYLLYRVCLTCLCVFFFYGDNMRLFKYMYNLLRYQPTEQSSWGQLALPVQEIPAVTVLESWYISHVTAVRFTVCVLLSVWKGGHTEHGMWCTSCERWPKGLCAFSQETGERSAYPRICVHCAAARTEKRKCTVLFFSGWCSDRTATSGLKQTKLHLYHQPPETSNCLLRAPTQHQQK